MKILLSLVLIVMHIVDGIGAITGANVIEPIDYLNDVYYAIEENMNK